MPYDMVFRHTEDMAYRMWETAKALIPLDCKVVLEGRGTTVKTGPFLRFLLCLFPCRAEGERPSLQDLPRFQEMHPLRPLRPDCPTKNIAMTEKGVRFSGRCLLLHALCLPLPCKRHSYRNPGLHESQRAVSLQEDGRHRQRKEVLPEVLRAIFQESRREDPQSRGKLEKTRKKRERQKAKEIPILAEGISGQAFSDWSESFR